MLAARTPASSRTCKPSAGRTHQCSHRTASTLTLPSPPRVFARSTRQLAGVHTVHLAHTDTHRSTVIGQQNSVAWERSLLTRTQGRKGSLVGCLTSNQGQFFGSSPSACRRSASLEERAAGDGTVLNRIAGKTLRQNQRTQVLLLARQESPGPRARSQGATTTSVKMPLTVRAISAVTGRLAARKSRRGGSQA